MELERDRRFPLMIPAQWLQPGPELPSSAPEALALAFGLRSLGSFKGSLKGSFKGSFKGSLKGSFKGL